MSYAVVFSSKAGNTELIARRIRKTLGEEGCVYFGSPAEAGDEVRRVGTVFAGSWTDKGTSTDDMHDFLQTLDGARVFLFGTCGFGGSDEYKNTILGRMREGLPTSCELLGSFMCQGKMPESVLERYHGMLAAAEPGSPDARRIEAFIKNFEVARSHPDSDDLRDLDLALREAGLA